MPNCTAQQVAYDLAVITEAVRLAQWSVEQAEAMLAHLNYTAAMNARLVAGMALTQCQMGGGMPPMPMMRAEEADPIIKCMQATVVELRTIRDSRLARATKMEADIDQ